MSSAMLSGALMLVLPCLILVVVRRKFHLPWKFVGVGAGMFMVAQVLKALFAVPLSLAGLMTAGSWTMILIGAVLPGVWEELTKYLPLKWLRAPNWNSVVAFGIGFGAIESVFIGIQVLALAAAQAAGQLPPELPSMIQAQLQPTSGALGAFFTAAAVVERGSAMAVHLGFAVLNGVALRKNRIAYLGLAMILHTLLDVGAGYMQYRAQTNVSWLLAFEVLFGLFAFGAYRYARTTIQEPMAA